jgi:uncharacterized membrane protein YccC
MPRPTPSRLASIGTLARRELHELITINPSDRPWELPFAVAIAAGLPMLLGAWFGKISDAGLASVGAMTIVYVPRTRLDHRMATVMAAAFAMISCFALGQLSQLVPIARAPIIALVAAFVTMGCRYYRVIPPGPLFFVMATAIGAYTPGEIADVPARLGVFALGSIGAVVVAFLYNVHILRSRAPLPASPPPDDLLDVVVIDSMIIGSFVGVSLGAAQILGLDKPYWVPVSCLAVIQGINLRAIWNRQVHRIIGTMIGLAVTWMLVRHATDPWVIALAIMTLTFCIETAIVRHYAFATIFITPLTILLAEAPTLGYVDSSTLIMARFADTVLGSLVGLAGGICLHSAALRQLLRRRP